MDINKTFSLRNEDRCPVWHNIDAGGKVLGRLATQIADILRGKDKPYFTPHIDCGDYVVITNCEKVVMTGRKSTDKIYKSYSGWRGGLKEKSAKDVMSDKPEEILKHAVQGMLPKNKLSRELIKKLKVYAGSKHPHTAQIAK
ncbi:50S ribosomal protein L13 [bacterium]|jgi:large subunit ribosomal protein L13|nr:50S ribosomal protein L13 [bacterium]